MGSERAVIASAVDFVVAIRYSPLDELTYEIIQVPTVWSSPDPPVIQSSSLFTMDVCASKYCHIIMI